MENESRYSIAHPEGGKVLYELHDDGHITGVFDLKPGHEVTLGLGSDSMVSGRITRLKENVVEESPKILSHSSGLTLDTNFAEVTTLQGETKKVTLNEEKILYALLTNMNSIVRYEQFAEILDCDVEAIPNILKVYIKRIRSKIGDGGRGDEDQIIKNIRQFGYTILDEN